MECATKAPDQDRVERLESVYHIDHRTLKRAQEAPNSWWDMSNDSLLKLEDDMTDLLEKTLSRARSALPIRRSCVNSIHRYLI